MIAIMTQRAAEYNNVGVALVSNGQLTDALISMRQALHSLTGLLNTTSNIPDKLVDTNGTSIVGVSQSIPLPFVCKIQSSKCPTEDESSLLHTAPFLIDPRAGAYSNEPLLNTSIASAIILFNLGIIYHLKSIDDKGLEEKLMKARDLYEKSRVVLCESGVSFGSTGNPVVDMLYMAVTNNLAQASYDLVSYDAARCYLFLLVEFALSIHPRLYSTPQTALFLEAEKNRFILIASLRHIPDFAPAA